MFAIGMFILNESKFAGYALRSWLACGKDIDAIAVVEGCVKLNEHACTEDGLSKDNTAEVVWDVMDEYDKDGKITFDRFGWAKDKAELQNRCLELTEGYGAEYFVLTAGDEIWDKDEIHWLAGFLRRQTEIHVVCPTFYHFWHRPDVVCRGSSWSVLMHRIYKFRPETRFKWHAAPPSGLGGKTYKTDKVHVWHFSAMQDEINILRKLEFYKKRDGHRLKVRPDYWTEWDYDKWRRGVRKPTQWTHGSGEAFPFKGQFPDVIEADVWKLLPKRIKTP